MTTPSLPTPSQLRAAPQLGALAILDAALLTAEEVLLAYHPAHAELDAVLHGERAPPEGDLVPILIARFDELHHLLARYHAAIRGALAHPANDFPF